MNALAFFPHTGGAGSTRGLSNEVPLPGACGFCTFEATPRHPFIGRCSSYGTLRLATAERKGRSRALFWRAA
jgi:hypothetical protein